MNSFTTWNSVILQHVFIRVFNKDHSNDTNIIHYFVLHGLLLFIRLNNYVENMFYAYSFSHNTAVPISINQDKYYLSLSTYTTLFSWSGGNSNKHQT